MLLTCKGGRETARETKKCAGCHDKADIRKHQKFYRISRCRRQGDDNGGHDPFHMGGAGKVQRQGEVSGDKRCSLEERLRMRMPHSHWRAY